MIEWRKYDWCDNGQMELLIGALLGSDRAAPCLQNADRKAAFVSQIADATVLCIRQTHRRTHLLYGLSGKPNGAIYHLF